MEQCLFQVHTKVVERCSDKTFLKSAIASSFSENTISNYTILLEKIFMNVNCHEKKAEFFLVLVGIYSHLIQRGFLSYNDHIICFPIQQSSFKCLYAALVIHYQ